MTADKPRGAKTAIWQMLIVAFFWGFNWPAVKILLATASPLSLRAAGVSGGALFLLAWTKISGVPLTVPRTHWRTVAIAGVLNVALFNIFVVFGQLTMPTSRAAILTFTMPLWAALFAWKFLGEALDRKRLLSLGTGALGLIVLSVPFWNVLMQGGNPIGLAFVLGAAISWALGTVYLKGHPIPAAPLAVTTWQIVVSAVVCNVAMGLFETPHLDLGATPQMLAFAYHIILPQAICYILWFDLVRRIPAGTAALGTLLVPIFGVIGAILLLGDWPTALDLLGLALVLAAIAIDRSRAQPGH